MASPNAAWRAHPFRVGLIYEARETFRGAADGEFIAGKRYMLSHIGYSRYDSATVFRFQAHEAESVDWWWSDDEPETLCVERFCLASVADGKFWRVLIIGEGFRIGDVTRNFELTGIVEATNTNDAFSKACELARRMHPELAQATGPFPRPVIHADEIQELHSPDGVQVDAVDLEWL